MQLWCGVCCGRRWQLSCRVGSGSSYGYKYFYAFKYDTSASAKIQNLTRYYCEHYQRSGLARLSLSLRHSESPTQSLLNNATKPQMFNRTCKCWMLKGWHDGGMEECERWSTKLVTPDIGTDTTTNWHLHYRDHGRPGQGDWKTWAILETRYTRRWIYGEVRLDLLWTEAEASDIIMGPRTRLPGTRTGHGGGEG